MRFRWPYLVALLLTGLVVAGRFAAPPLAAKWEARQERLHLAAFVRDNPAAKNLGHLRVPEGMRDDCPGPDPMPVGYRVGLCWTSETIPARAASKATQETLIGAGATGVKERCKARPRYVICRVDARLAGQAVGAFIGPQVSSLPMNPRGSSVEVSIFPSMIPDVRIPDAG
jgi:hypothetical protein